MKRYSEPVYSRMPFCWRLSNAGFQSCLNSPIHALPKNSMASWVASRSDDKPIDNAYRVLNQPRELMSCFSAREREFMIFIYQKLLGLWRMHAIWLKGEKNT